MDNKSIAEYAEIKIELLSRMITLMLAVNAMGVTVTVGLLDTQFNELGRTALMILIFSAATAVGLFFLASRYFDTVSQRIGFVQSDEVEAVTQAAKRFFRPFALCLVMNILIALTGAIFLTVAVLS